MSVRVSLLRPQSFTATGLGILYNAAYSGMEWVRVIALGSGADLLYIGSGSAFEFDRITINNSTGKFDSRTSNTTTNQTVSSTAVITLGIWYFLAMVRQSATLWELFLGTTPANIASQGTVTVDQSARSASTKLVIGSNGGTPGAAMFDVRGTKIIPVNCTLAQLQAEALASQPVTLKGDYWPLRFESDYQNYNRPGTGDLVLTNGPLVTMDDPEGDEFFFPPVADVAIGGWTALTPVASDSFTGTAGTDINAHTSDTGHSWAVPSWSPDPTPMELTAANRLRPGATQAFNRENLALLSYTPASADYTVRATIRVPNALPEVHEQDRALVLRADSAAATYYRADFDFHNALGGGTGSYWYIAKKIAGVETQLGIYAVSYPAGTSLAVVFGVIGTTLTLTVNGLVILQVTDASISAAGQGGLYNFIGSEVPADGTPDFDDFQLLETATANLYTGIDEPDPANDADYVLTGSAPVADTLKLSAGWSGSFGAGPVMTEIRHKKI